MSPPQLVPPSVRYFASFQESNREWAGHSQDGAPLWIAEGMGLDLTREADFARWVEQLLVEADPSYLAPGGRVPSTTLWVVRDGDYLGSLSLRHRLNTFLATLGGHIGYGIRPSARRQGLATFALRGALERARTLGLERVLVTCRNDNEGSWRTIESCGGVLECVREPDEYARDAGYPDPMRRYWISVGLA